MSCKTDKKAGIYYENNFMITVFYENNSASLIILIMSMSVP